MMKSTDQKRMVVLPHNGKKKEPYKPPRLVKYGDIRTITLAPTFGEQFESGYGDSNWMG